jgi:Zn-dependent M28 family amino/carboxypeptidase
MNFLVMNWGRSSPIITWQLSILNILQIALLWQNTLNMVRVTKAARQGVEGILIIHETEGAGYQYTIPGKSSITPRLYMQTADSNRTLCMFTGWLSAASADSLFSNIEYNVTSMAWALEIGEAFSGLKKRPLRSVLILFPTAEEQGLLGSQYYTENPVIPMEKTVACFNNYLMLPIGRMNSDFITVQLIKIFLSSYLEIL